MAAFGTHAQGVCHGVQKADGLFIDASLLIGIPFSAHCHIIHQGNFYNFWSIFRKIKLLVFFFIANAIALSSSQPGNEIPQQLISPAFALAASKISRCFFRLKLPSTSR